MMPHVKPLMLALLLAATAGCLFTRAESRPVHTYQLSPDAQFPGIEARGTNKTGPILLVGLPQPDPGFDTRRMVYVTRPYELNYYSANEWADTPGRMLCPLLIRALEHTGLWQAVIAAPSLLRPDYRVDLNGLVLAQEFIQSPSRVRISWRAQLIDLREGRVLGTRRFDVVREAPSEDAYGGVEAANLVLGELLNGTVSWLGACVADRGKAAC